MVRRKSRSCHGSENPSRLSSLAFALEKPLNGVRPFVVKTNSLSDSSSIFFTIGASGTVYACLILMRSTGTDQVSSLSPLRLMPATSPVCAPVSIMTLTTLPNGPSPHASHSLRSSQRRGDVSLSPTPVPVAPQAAKDRGQPHGRTREARGLWRERARAEQRPSHLLGRSIF
jgi:hypothetical protein